MTLLASIVIKFELNTHAETTAFAIVLYLVALVIFLSLYGLFTPISSFEELDYELEEFVDYYKETSYWWFTAFFATIVSLTVGKDQSIVFDFLILGAFFIPSGIYFYRNYPFSLNCKYRPTLNSGLDSFADEKENIAFPDDDGRYSLDIVIRTGSNIDEFLVDTEVPQGVEAKAVQRTQSEANLTKTGQIKGKAPPGKDEFVIRLILVENTGISSEGRYIVFSDSDSGRELLSVKLYPNQGSI